MRRGIMAIAILGAFAPAIAIAQPAQTPENAIRFITTVAERGDVEAYCSG